MPIYLVRWPRPGAVLIRARNEEHLKELLDQVADPTNARWSVYRGPLWLDFDLPTKAKDDAAGGSEFDLDAMLGEGGIDYQVSMGDTDAGIDMHEAVTREAMPHVHAVLDAHAEERAETGEFDKEREAVRESRWRERLADAIEADETEMNALVHRRELAEARAAGPGQYVTQCELHEAAALLERALIGEPAKPRLKLVNDDGSESDADDESDEDGL
jgi:hypothetical protein